MYVALTFKPHPFGWNVSYRAGTQKFARRISILYFLHISCATQYTIIRKTQKTAILNEHSEYNSQILYYVLTRAKNPRRLQKELIYSI